MSAINPTAASQDNSTTAFLTSLAVNFALLVAEVGAFLLLKKKLWRIYSPRAELPPVEKRADKLPDGLWKWIPALITSPSHDIIQKNGLDAYMFIRFIRLLVRIFLAFTVLTFLVIIPVDIVGVKGAMQGVERISWTNVIDPREQNRFAAHVVVVYVLTAFVVYLIYREMSNFVQLRHQFLLSPGHSHLAQSRTVLMTSIPQELGNERDMKTFASFVPGGVDKVWLYRDTKRLNVLFERRRDLCEKLEAAESVVLRHAVQAWRKKVRLHHKAQRGKVKDEEGNPVQLEKPQPSMELLDELVPAKYRPTTRVGFFGMCGTKVDTIRWCTTEISKLNVAIKSLRQDTSEHKFLGSAFVRCNLQMGAHILSQCVSYHEPLFMVDKWMEAHPRDIVWNNLDDGALEMKGRYITSWLATIGLIIAWAFPVGFIGTLSNLSELCVKVRWLQWVCDLPDIPRGIIEGVLPPLLLAALFALLPLILRALAWYECIPRYSLISVSVYRRFYLFLLIHGFLIVTLSSGITNAIGDILQKPTQTVQELASKLPGASVFFLTYMVTQGLAGAGAALAQLVPLILYYIRKKLLGRTPRQAYEVTFTMPSADFGVLLPRMSLLATIAFAYSVMSPLINLLALVSFAMFYLAWKLLFVQVFDQPDESETGGMYFPMAINNLFVGLYIEHICLSALFFLRAVEEGAGAIVKGVMMLVLAGLTATAQIFIINSFDHLLHFLPMSLATQKMAKKFEKQKLKKQNPETKSADSEDEPDLFSRKRIQSVRKRIKKSVGQKLDAIKGKKFSEDGHEKLKGASSNVDLTMITSMAVLENNYELQRIPTNKSNKSNKSRHSKDGKEDDHPVVIMDAPAPAVVNPDDSDDSDVEEAADDHAFDHPSTYQAQTWVWVPKDPLGLSELMTKELRDAGIDASDVGAFMDEKGVVEVRRNPPDEEWSGGHDA